MAFSMVALMVDLTVVYRDEKIDSMEEERILVSFFGCSYESNRINPNQSSSSNTTPNHFNLFTIILSIIARQGEKRYKQII